MQTPPPALAVANLSFDYGERRALCDVSLRIEPRETVLLLGPNGAGKSTLFALIAGLFHASRGAVRIGGLPVGRTSRALASLGIVWQSTTLDLDLSVEQNLRYFCALHGISRRQANARLDEILPALDLDDRRRDTIRALNGGHRRRVEIARAILHQPRLLLLDEPTVGLDVPTRKLLIERLHELPHEEGMAVLWATHLIDEIRPDDRLLLLHQGRLHHDGRAADLLADYQAVDAGELLRLVMQASPQMPGEIVAGGRP